jgi:hypothetical protein
MPVVTLRRFRHSLTTRANVAPLINSGAGPTALAFDASGTLWIGNANGVATTVVGYSSSQLATTGSPVPASTINLPTSGVNPAVAYGLAVDASGQRWVCDALNSELYAYIATQLAAGGAPTPPVTINSSALNGPSGIAFDPHATTLPLH